MNPQTKVKRITVKLKTPNPLFERWLTDWKDKANENGSKMQYTFSLALNSLKKYPLPLETGKDCGILKGFGNKLCEMLDKKLKEHLSEKHSADTTIIYEHVESPSKKQLKQKRSPKSSKNNKYKPTYRSGAYAILVTLLKKSLEPNYTGYLTKDEIIKSARDLCDKSFIKFEPGSFYTAWSSMTTLVSKGLVERTGAPAKFSLTDEGQRIALNLEKNGDSEQANYHVDKHNSEVSSSCKNNETPIINSSNSCVDKVSLTHNVPSTQKGFNTEKVLSTIIDNNIQSSSQVSSNAEAIIFGPYSFDILLLVDIQETTGVSKDPLNDETRYELNKLGILYEVRHMKVGDFTWLCRERTTKNELVLPYIVERKRMDDLSSSIRDGRFHEQKFRLKQCGIQNLMYIVESYGKNTHTSLPLSSLMQAATNTLIQDGFQVKFTQNHRHSMQYLAGFTMTLKIYFENKTIMSGPKETSVKHSVTDDLIQLITFKDFNKGASKNRHFKVHELFVRQILQLKGISVEKVIAIVEKYPTPRLLCQEYDRLGIKGEKLLTYITYGPLKRSIGLALSRTIYQLYTSAKLL